MSFQKLKFIGCAVIISAGLGLTGCGEERNDKVQRDGTTNDGTAPGVGNTQTGNTAPGTDTTGRGTGTAQP